MLHPGNVRLLQFVREFGDRLVVGVDGDEIAGSDANLPRALRLEVGKAAPSLEEAFLILGSADASVRLSLPSSRGMSTSLMKPSRGGVSSLTAATN